MCHREMTLSSGMLMTSSFSPQLLTHTISPRAVKSVQCSAWSLLGPGELVDPSTELISTTMMYWYMGLLMSISLGSARETSRLIFLSEFSSVLIMKLALLNSIKDNPPWTFRYFCSTALRTFSNSTQLVVFLSMLTVITFEMQCPTHVGDVPWLDRMIVLFLPASLLIFLFPFAVISRYPICLPRCAISDLVSNKYPYLTSVAPVD